MRLLREGDLSVADLTSPIQTLLKDIGLSKKAEILNKYFLITITSYNMAFTPDLNDKTINSYL